jgi:hypothetical protein
LLVSVGERDLFHGGQNFGLPQLLQESKESCVETFAKSARKGDRTCVVRRACSKSLSSERTLQSYREQNESGRHSTLRARGRGMLHLSASGTHVGS